MDLNTPEKAVVGVSLGSSGRDHRATLTLLDTVVAVERRGTDGDFAACAQLLASLDGEVDAIGLGGIDRWLVVDGQRYAIQDAERLVAHVSRTPVVDGRGLKETWEPQVIRRLVDEEKIHCSQRVLMVSALDRFGMADAFYDLGFATVAGDLIFGAGLDYPITSRHELVDLGKRLLPEIVKRPFAELYPLGTDQEREPDPRFSQYFADADIVAGDFHLIRRYLPSSLSGKVVITNTTTAKDMRDLERRGVRLLITTTPQLDGRSFGTNVMEAAIVAASGVSPEDLEWGRLIDRLDLHFGQTVWNV